MFHIKCCIKQKMFYMLSVPSVEITSIGTLKKSSNLWNSTLVLVED